ncbi:hypothetical protein [Streptomyces sp. NPDC056491]|uniref:hypothetical protein n=1 Tax=Streptomyces sp. NPDC056491 TaxID=3345837 RepID=UPI0036CE5335
MNPVNPVNPVNWADLVPGPPALAPYYDEVPGLTGVRLRSVHADGWGSCVILRLDLPRFPDRWDGGLGDTLQCQIGFSHVEDFVMEGWRPPVTADIGLTPLPRNRLAVHVTAPGTEVSFTTVASLTLGKVGVLTQDADGGDGGPRRHVRALYDRLYPTLPPTHVNIFYERA